MSKLTTFQIFVLTCSLSNACSVSGSPPLSVTVVAIGSYQYVTVVPAIEAAVELVNRQYAPQLRMNLSLVFQPKMQECTVFADNIADLAAKTYYGNENVKPSTASDLKVFLGPKLNVLFVSTARESKQIRQDELCATERKTPFESLRPFCVWHEKVSRNVVTDQNRTSVGTDGRISDKTLFPTTITCALSHHTVLVQGFRALLHHYHWTILFMICDANGDVAYFRSICQNFQIPRALGVGVRVSSITFNSAASQTVDFDGLLKRAAAASRVIWLGLSFSLTREFMIHAQRSNMTTNEYVYFCSWPYVAPSYQEIHWRTGDGHDDVVKEAFRQLFVVTFDRNRSLPQDDAVFVTTRSATTYNYSYGPGEMISSPVIASYETIIVLAKVLNESLSERGGNDLLQDGRKLARRFFNRTFTLPTGSVYINENGDRFPDLAVRHLHPETGYFETVLTYGAATLVVSTVDGTTIQWITGQPPSGQPGECGFDGKSCSSWGSSLDILALLAGGLFILIAAVTLRRFLTKPHSQDRWWLLTGSRLVAESDQPFNIY
ncbi:putative Atrial natriuretic peptide receptor 1 [Hypsibius exemplaris]|uniref:Atrial natriuretic peptide receptor 1 n=1 Tax=Hypsibius exemplaris TaxID=2072580 RepID=A0A1W0XE15_HYPEX|nr:putative Atrial natriuretic peptide receptor 1 [Hypsibius exemplaris]